MESQTIEQKEIEKLFEELGLGTQEDRDKYLDKFNFEKFNFEIEEEEENEFCYTFDNISIINPNKD